MAYNHVGKYFGIIAIYMGLAPDPQQPNIFEDVEDDEEFGARDQTAPAQYFAGWLYGISGQTVGLRDDILDCYKKDKELTKDCYRGMNKYMKGKTQQGNTKWEDAYKRYPATLAECGSDITGAWDEWTKKMGDLVSISDWNNIEDQIYEANKTQVDANTSYQFKTWTEGVFYNSGMFAGRNDKIFLENAPASSTLSSE